MILARLLSPNDFGLVGMVTAITGMLSWLRDFGLSSATVQRASITEEQLSTLFWVNIAFGAFLGVVALAMSPAIAAFYHEPRLSGITAVLAASFLFNAAGTQHSAILERQMRFTELAVINVLALTVGAAIAILGARVGYGYWALVAMTVVPPIIATGCFWLSSGWVPGAPCRRAGIRGMVHFGAGLTLTGFLVYLGYNADKILIGRFWGAEAIGVYGRAYQIISIPVDSLHGALAAVAFAALSRLRDESIRLRSYFLKGFSLTLGLTLPVAVACLLFADDVVFVLLGPKWAAVTDIMRLLAPTMMAFAIINPLGWLVASAGLIKRGLQVTLVRTTLMVSGCAIALPYGPNAVAFAYSAVLVLWIIPHICWSVHGTEISARDVFLAASGPLGSGIPAGALAYGARLMCGDFFSPLPRLLIESGVLGIVFFGMLLFGAGERSLYLDLLRGIRAPHLPPKPSLAQPLASRNQS
jgi:PST family polysaccharide transporter